LEENLSIISNGISLLGLIVLVFVFAFTFNVELFAGFWSVMTLPHTDTTVHNTDVSWAHNPTTIYYFPRIPVAVEKQWDEGYRY